MELKEPSLQETIARLKVEETKLLQERQTDLDQLKQKCLEDEKKWKASQKQLIITKEQWDLKLLLLKRLLLKNQIAEQQKKCDQYRYFFVKFKAKKCKLEDLPIFQESKISNSVVWKAISNTFAIVELETPLSKEKYKAEQDLTKEEIKTRVPYYWIKESDAQEMKEQMSLKKRSVYDLLCNEYHHSKVDHAFQAIFYHVDMSRSGMSRLPPDWEDAKDDPKEYRWLCEHTCCMCQHVIYSLRDDEWDEHVTIGEFNVCKDCIDDIIQLFKQQGIVVPRKLLLKAIKEDFDD